MIFSNFARVKTNNDQAFQGQLKTKSLIFDKTQNFILNNDFIENKIILHG